MVVQIFGMLRVLLDVNVISGRLRLACSLFSLLLSVAQIATHLLCLLSLEKAEGGKTRLEALLCFLLSGSVRLSWLALTGALECGEPPVFYFSWNKGCLAAVISCVLGGGRGRGRFSATPTLTTSWWCLSLVKCCFPRLRCFERAAGTKRMDVSCGECWVLVCVETKGRVELVLLRRFGVSTGRYFTVLCTLILLGFVFFVCCF